MWPKEKMPNPVAAKRLTELGCKVLYQQTHLLEPRKIKSPDDLRPNSKKGRIDRKPIWVVEVQMPKKIAFDIYKGYMDKMRGDDKEAMLNDGAPAPAPVAAPMPAGMPPAPPAPGGAPAAGGMPPAPTGAPA